MVKDKLGKCPLEWQEAAFDFMRLTPEAQKGLEPLIAAIHKELLKEADTDDELIDAFFHNGKSILKNALFKWAPSEKELNSTEVVFIERVAYYRRFKEVYKPKIVFNPRR